MSHPIPIKPKLNKNGQTLHRPRFFLPVDLGPWIACRSLRFNFNVPPVNLPTPGLPTPRSRRATLDLGPKEGRSNIIPFSFASALRFVSMAAALALIPLRCDSGIFVCSKTESFEPRLRSRKSIARCRCTPSGAEVLVLSSKCDSFSNL